MSRNNQIKFYDPFRGRKKKPGYLAFFLLDPNFFLKISCTSLRSMMTDIGEEAFYKKMQAADTDKKRLKVLEEAKAKFEIDQHFIDQIVASLKSCNNEGVPGAFEFFREGINLPDKQYSYTSNFIVEIERQTYKPFLTYLDGDHANAMVDLLSKDICQHVLWPEVESILRNQPDRNSIRLINTVVSFEVLLAIIAALDLHLQGEMKLSSSAFKMLLPNSLHMSHNPSKLLFELCKTKLESRSVNHLIDTSAGNDFEYNESSFDRWSAGSQLPAVKSFSQFLSANFEGNDKELLWQSYYVTRILNYIGFMFQDMQKVFKSMGLSDAQLAELRPLPDFPFGHKSIHSWLKDRYPYWLTYHQKKLARRE